LVAVFWGWVLTRIAPRFATEEQLALVHTAEYIGRVKRESEQPKGATGDRISPFGKGAYHIAALGAGSAIAMTEAVVNGTVDYALVNPAGHHVLPENGMGFCIFNNVADDGSTPRPSWASSGSAIVDWDVRHGNGAQAIFCGLATTETLAGVGATVHLEPTEGHLSLMLNSFDDIVTELTAHLT
jgi:acetoin utilization deacetylase AcuC-like enzyme